MDTHTPFTHKKVFLWIPRYDIYGDLMWGRATKWMWADGRVEFTKRGRV